MKIYDTSGVYVMTCDSLGLNIVSWTMVSVLWEFISGSLPVWKTVIKGSQSSLITDSVKTMVTLRFPVDTLERQLPFHQWCKMFATQPQLSWTELDFWLEKCKC